MSSRVNSSRQSAYDGQSRIGELVGEFLGRFRAVMRCAPCADDTDGMMIALVVAFRNSDNLAAAYGVAVTTTMVITTILFYVLATQRWKWPVWAAGPLCAIFLVVDLAFFSANIIKVEHGGWLPLIIALGIFTLMSTWKRGRRILGARLAEETLDMDLFLADIERRGPVRVPGIAVWTSCRSPAVPQAVARKQSSPAVRNLIFTPMPPSLSLEKKSPAAREPAAGQEVFFKLRLAGLTAIKFR